MSNFRFLSEELSLFAWQNTGDYLNSDIPDEVSIDRSEEYHLTAGSGPIHIHFIGMSYAHYWGALMWLWNVEQQ